MTYPAKLRRKNLQRREKLSGGLLFLWIGKEKFSLFNLGFVLWLVQAKPNSKKKKLERKKPVEEEKGKEDESGKSIGIDNKDKVIHSFGHCCFAQCA